ncbi:MAG: pyridoxal-phosphate dependent enzyme [Firmicutes bacterium]|nr:pyridoxal-phosphate dependent enzyme [Bacillota bacterium]
MSLKTLSARYPVLGRTIPHLELGDWPTPLERLPGISAEPLLLIKREDLSHPLYGGNKVRKLELILADVKRKGFREIVTAGGLGSHHILAVAALGRELGLRTTGLFFCQPVNEHVQKNLLLEAEFGTEMHYVRNYPGVALGYLRIYLGRRLDPRRKTYLLMPGGSSALSTLGYVGAVLELEQQLREQGLPDPEAIFCAAGTGGTAAGLLAGIALTGMKSRLHAVRVVPPILLGRRKIVGLARSSLKLLGRRGVDTGEAVGRLESRLYLEESYLGEGYGFATDAAAAAISRFQESGIKLEGCYTGKAAAACLDYCAARKGSSGSVVFMHTASTTHQECDRAALEPKLPPDFRWCFTGNPPSSR